MTSTLLSERFATLRAAGRPAFCPYLTVGFPTPDVSVRLAAVASSSGADVIEIGVPFSDPLADGPTIQLASKRALDAGVRFDDTLRAVRAAREAGPALPVVMTYYNPVHRMGVDAFVGQVADAGAAGLIVPDLPLEEADDLRNAAAARGLDHVALVAPTTPTERVARIAARAGGFLYLVAVTGVTGARRALDEGLVAYLDRVRSQTELPLCVGFGISTPEQGRRVGRVADGVIVGSALVECLRSATGDEEAVLAREVGAYARAMGEAR